ncbi:MAG TPA: hypothetical protein VL068_06180 [Microthrixaceae bacterium]|nr:hypothetical protein [Microthrixaceae bacterium]
MRPAQKKLAVIGVLAAVLLTVVLPGSATAETDSASGMAGSARGAASAKPTQGTKSKDAPLGRAERVFVFSVPTLTWSDLDQTDAPNLKAVLGKSAIADLSVRSVSRQTTPTDGYATLNAGTRTRGTSSASLAFVAGVSRTGSVDSFGDPVEIPIGAFDPPGQIDNEPGSTISAPQPDPIDPASIPPEAGETYDGTPAAEEFARRTGVLPELGEVFNFGLVSMKALNSQLLYGSEVGALGDALKSADVSRAVIANGDHGASVADTSFRREASVALMDSDGLVQRGRVGRSLLEVAPESPFGTRYDIPKVETAFKRFFRDRSVVLVEASDMVRFEDAKPLSTPEQQIRLRRQAIERSDELLGVLMGHVDPSTDAVLVVAPYASGYGNGLTAISVMAPSVEVGFLSSGTTRRSGFVQTVDIAPTIASLLDVDVPTSMEGTLMESLSTAKNFDQRRQFLRDSFDAAKFRDSIVGPASGLFVLVQLILWALAIFVLSGESRRFRTTAEVATLAVLAYLPVTYLAGLFPFYRWGSAAFWGFTVLASAALGLLAYLPARKYLVDPLITTLALIIGVLSVDIITGGLLQFNTVFGYTPTVAGRFDGMGNPAFSMFTSAAIMLAALLAHRIGGRRGAWVGVGLLVWTLLVDGLPIWGADVGGALALVPSIGVTALMLLEVKIKVRTLVSLAIGAVVSVTVLGLADLMRPPAERTHLGRLLADISNNGAGAFETVVLRKLDANVSVITSSVWTLMLPLVFAFIGYIFWKAPWRLQTIAERIPQERAAVAGLSCAMVLGFALNDSGIAVPGMMLGVISASLIHLMLRVDAEVLPTGSEDGSVQPDDSDGLADSDRYELVRDAALGSGSEEIPAELS